ncbi:MAG: hypothetical protein V3T60_13030 [Candidatus Binatia bacterium]
MTLTLTSPGSKVYPDFLHPCNLGQPIYVPVVSLLHAQMPSQPACQSTPGTAGINIVAMGKSLQAKAPHMEASCLWEAENEVIDWRQGPTLTHPGISKVF